MMRWPLFLLLFWTVPFPLFGLDGLAVPVARFVQLAASLSVLVLLEGAGGMVGSMLALLWVHSIVYSLILFGITKVLAKVSAPILPAGADRWLFVGLTVALLSWGFFGEPYDTSFHHSDPHASLMRIYR